jgi:hypothetical protein
MAERRARSFLADMFASADPFSTKAAGPRSTAA